MGLKSILQYVKEFNVLEADSGDFSFSKSKHEDKSSKVVSTLKIKDLTVATTLKTENFIVTATLKTDSVTVAPTTRNFTILATQKVEHILISAPIETQI